MKMLMIAFVFTCFMHGPAHASLGESEKQVEKKYGGGVMSKGSSTRDYNVTYNHGGLVIYVIYLGKISQSEIYDKADGSSFSAKEIQGILKQNAMGGEWKRPVDENGERLWVLKSKAASVSSSKRDVVLWARTNQYENYSATLLKPKPIPNANLATPSPSK